MSRPRSYDRQLSSQPGRNPARRWAGKPKAKLRHAEAEVPLFESGSAPGRLNEKTAAGFATRM